MSQFEEREEEVRFKRKYCVPIAVTTPNRGPLLLVRGGRGEASRRGRMQAGCEGRRMLQLPRKPAKHSLTRFPVAMVQRPLQEIESELGHLSITAIQDCMLLPAQTKKVVLPHLHPMMKYSPLNNGLHGNHQAPPTTENYIYRKREGNMGVSITYSRHSPVTSPSHLPESSPSHTSPDTAQCTDRYLLPLGQSTLNPSPLSHVSNTAAPQQRPPAALPAPQGELQVQITNSYLHSHTPEDWGRLDQHSPSLVCPPPSGSSLAPPSLQAVVTHIRKPLTQHTTLRGRRIIL